MTLSADEKTVHDGQPKELYDFELDGGDVAAYYLTDFEQDLSVLGNTYLSVKALKRSPIVTDGPAMVSDINVTMPYNQPLIDEICFRIPPRAVRLTIRRYHISIVDVGIIWKGEVTQTTVQGREAMLSVPSQISRSLQILVPTAACQGLCVHMLFDDQCDPTGTLRTGHDRAVTVSAIDSVDPRIITVNSVGAEPDQTYRGGELLRDSDGEERTVLDQTGVIVSVDIPFRNLAVSNPMTLFEGCDHTIATCRTKFLNKDNFTGFPNIPAADVFRFGGDGRTA